MRISDWSSDVCSSDLNAAEVDRQIAKTTDSEKITKLRQMRKVGFLNVPSASIIHQIRLFYAAIVGIEALLSKHMSAVTQAAVMGLQDADDEIGRASGRERVCQYV